MTSQVIDFSTARPGPAAIKAAGYAGVIRYLAYWDPANPNPKIITASELAGYRQAGIPVAFVWETSAGAALGGYAVGLAHAQAAHALLNSLGVPASVPVYYAVDTQISFGAIPVILDYFRGVKAGSVRPVGVYGQASVLDAVGTAGVASYFWQTMAWSAGVISARAMMVQVVGGSKLTDTDVNIVSVSDWGQYPRPGGSATVIGGVGMWLVRVRISPSQTRYYVVWGNGDRLGYRWLSDAASAALQNGGKNVDVTMSGPDFTAFCGETVTGGPSTAIDVNQLGTLVANEIVKMLPPVPGLDPAAVASAVLSALKAALP